MKKAFIFSAGSRGFSLWLYVVAVIGVLVSGVPTVSAEGSYRAHAEALLLENSQIASDVEQAILLLLNNYRASMGRRPLQSAEADTVMAARAHAADLLSMGKVGHVASTGHNFESRMRALRGGGMITLPPMSENAARDRRKGVSDSDKAKAIMQQWIDSPRHRKSLTDRSYTSVAIGAVKHGDVIYAVQIFVGPETKNNLFQSN